MTARKATGSTLPAAPTRGGYDAGARRQSTRTRRQRGCYVYIPAEELASAGISPFDHRTHGHRRSRNGHTVIVTLYREP